MYDTCQACMNNNNFYVPTCCENSRQKNVVIWWLRIVLSIKTCYYNVLTVLMLWTERDNVFWTELFHSVCET
jgi:hypothetical protein